MTALRSQRAAVSAACAGDPAGLRTCRKQAVGLLKAARRTCRRAKVACKSCCRTDGKPCADLGLVPAAARSTSASIGADGGSLTATGLDGATYRFAVPAGALVSEQTITMTPVAAVTNLPFSGGLAAAVQFEPEGLVFLTPATLVVTLPDTVDRQGLVGFGFHRAGEGPHLTITTANDRELTFAVPHFSGVGAARGTRDDLAALVGQLSESFAAQLSSEFAENLYTSQIAQLMAQDVRDPLAYQQVLREWVRVSLQVTLGLTLTESGVNQALQEYLGWKAAIESVSNFLGFDFAAAMTTDVEEVDRLMARVLANAGIDGAQARCFLAPSVTSDPDAVVQAQLSAANDALGWFRILEGLGLTRSTTTASSLALVLERLCVAVGPFDARIVPDDVAPGQSGELRVRAGLTLRNVDQTPRTQVFAPPLDVQASATGTEEPIAGGPTDTLGIFHGPFRRFGDAPVAFDVRACIVQPQLPFLRAVCGATELVGGSTTSTTTSTTTTTSGTAQGGVHFNCCVENVSNCDFNLIDVTSRDAGSQENTRVRVRLLDQNGQQVSAPVHVSVDLPPPPPLLSCPSCGQISTLDENGNMIGPRFTYETPAGSGTATITLEATIGGTVLRRDFVIRFNNTVMQPPVLVPNAHNDPVSGSASAGAIAQVGDRYADFVTITVEGAPPAADVGVDSPDISTSASVFIAPGGPHQPPPGTYTTTITARDARGLTSTVSFEFTASDAGDHVVLVESAPAN